MSMQQPVTVPVALGAASYDIVIGSGLLREAGKHIAPHLARPFTVIVTDETVAKLHLVTLVQALKQAGIKCPSVCIAPGEGSKSLNEVEDLCTTLVALGVERGDVIVALEGVRKQE